MPRTLLTFVVATLLGLGSALAQEGGAGAGRIEIGAFPGGGMFFTSSTKTGQPDFGNYALGASFTFNMNRWVGVEGELGGGLGIHQTLTFNEATLPNQ